MSNKTILGFCWDNPYLFEFYLPLIRGLEKKGIKFCFITTGYTTKKLFISCGIESFAYSDILTPDLQRKVDHWWNGLQINSINWSNLEYEGYNLYSLSEYDRILLGKEPTTKQIKNLFCRTALLLEGWLSVFEYTQPCMVFTWDGTRIESNMPAEIARNHNLPVYFFERGFFPNTLVLDPEGVNYRSYIAGDGWNEVTVSVSGDDSVKVLDYIDQYHRNAETVVKQSQKKISKAELYKDLQIPEHNKIMLFPLQIESDANILFFSPLFKSMIDIITFIQNLLEQEFSDYTLVIKPHPEDKDRISELQNILNPKSRLVLDVHLHSLIQASDTILTVNSNVGLESLTYYKPVIVLGKSIYSHKGATYDIEQKADIVSTLAEIAQKNSILPMEKEAEINKIVYYLLRYYLYFRDAKEVFANSNDEIENKILSQMAPEVKFQGRQSRNIQEALLKTEQYLSMTKKLKEELQNAITQSPKKVLLIITSRFDSLSQFTENLITQLNTSKCDYLIHENIDPSTLFQKNVNAIYKYSSKNMFGLFRCLLKKYDLVILISNQLEHIGKKYILVTRLIRGTRKLKLDSFVIKYVMGKFNVN